MRRLEDIKPVTTFHFNKNNENNSFVLAGVEKLSQDLSSLYPFIIQEPISTGVRTSSSRNAEFVSLGLVDPNILPFVFIEVLGKENISPNSLRCENTDNYFFVERALKCIYGEGALLEDIYILGKKRDEKRISEHKYIVYPKAEEERRKRKFLKNLW